MEAYRDEVICSVLPTRVLAERDRRGPLRHLWSGQLVLVYLKLSQETPLSRKNSWSPHLIVYFVKHMLVWSPGNGVFTIKMTALPSWGVNEGRGASLVIEMCGLPQCQRTLFHGFFKKAIQGLPIKCGLELLRVGSFCGYPGPDLGVVIPPEHVYPVLLRPYAWLCRLLTFALACVKHI